MVIPGTVMLSENHRAKGENPYLMQYLVLPECILVQSNQLPANGHVGSLRDGDIARIEYWSLFSGRLGLWKQHC